MSHTIAINRAPVLTLWATVVAERLGFNRGEALTLGRAVAGLNAHAKAVSLGIVRPTPGALEERRRSTSPGEVFTVDLLGRSVPVAFTPDGIRAISKDKPIAPASVQRYLASKFGDALEDATAAMRALAESYPPEELGERAWALYERFRPAIPRGVEGWGVEGVLDLARIASITRAG
jgi:hypothetical protein